MQAFLFIDSFHAGKDDLIGIDTAAEFCQQGEIC